MEISPIKTEKDYEAALEEIEKLMDAAPGSPEGDRLEILSILAEDYEEKIFPIEAPDPVAAILHEIESQDISKKDLEKYIGSRARVSEVLDRKRPLSLIMIRKLNAGPGISADILIRDYPPGDNS